MILYLATINMLGYLLFVVWQYGKQKSISDSDYMHNNILRGWFESSLVFASIALYTIGFYSGAGFIVVAIFSNFKKNRFNKVMHNLGAYGGFIGYIVELVLHGYWWMSLIIAIITLLVYCFNKFNQNKIFIIEVSLIYMMFISVYLIK